MVTNAPVARRAAAVLAILMLAGCSSSSGDVPFPFPGPGPGQPANRAPVASDDTARAPHRGEVSIFPLGNDADPDLEPVFLASFTQPAHGAVSALSYSLTAGLWYRAPAGFEGVDTFTYTISDGKLWSEPATVRVTVAANTPPTARGESLWTFEDTPTVLYFYGSDVEDHGVGLRGEVVTHAGHGRVTFRTTPEHVLVYTPDPDWAGTDVFTYRVFDTEGAASEPAVVSVTVQPVDDPLVLEVASSLVTDEDTPLELTAKATDVDSPPGALGIFASVSPAHGEIIPTRSTPNTFTFRYVPYTNFSGVDAVTFSTWDGSRASASRRVQITVNSVNDAPVASGGWGITPEDLATDVFLSGNDIESPAAALRVEVVSRPEHGTVTPTSGPAPLRVTYTPEQDWVGPARFAYRMVDPSGALSDPAEAVISVTAVNDPPRAAAVAPIVTVEDTPVQLTLSGTDPDDAVTALVITIDQPPVHGAVSARSGIAPLAVTWTPAPGWSGKDQLTFRVRDRSGALSAPVVVALEATPDPDAPAANADAAVACVGAATRIRVLANDADADGDPLVIASVTPGRLGTTRVDGDAVVYTALPGSAGTDAFTYAVADGTGRTATGKVAVELSGPEVRALLPASGTTGGPLQISGRCLGAAQGTVTIGGRPAAVTTWTPRLVVVTVPAGFDPGVHELVVTPPAAPPARSSYEVVPWIARVEPFLVDPGEAQTIVGDGFVTAGKVGYGDVVATVDRWTGSAIQSRMPRAGPSKLSAVTSTRATTNVYPVVGAGPDTWWTERVPAGRSEHTAVWTGTEMIVFGGRPGSGGTPLGDGGRYDPRHDSWIPISPPAAQAAGRTGHSAVWTGTELIVWGGATGGTPGRTGTGLRYDPRSDGWTPTATATSTAWAPAAREGHSAVWTGTRMLVWGGVSWTQLSDGASYDPVTDSWETLPDAGAPSPRQGHVAVWTGKEMIVWGGLGAGGYSAVGTGARYDPAKKTWAAMSDRGAPSARGHAAAVWTGEELVVWGGWSGGAYLGDGARYDPVSDTWRPLPAGAPAPRSGASAVWTGTELIVWSGGDAAGAVASGGRYDPAADAWAPLDDADAPAPRRNQSTIWTGAELIAWGGAGGLDTGVRFAPATGTWTATRHGTPGEPEARRDHAWACLPGGDLVVWGGSVVGGDDVATGARYLAATGTWTPLAQAGAPSAREGATAVWTGTHLLVWGGARVVAGTPTYLGDGARYDPAADEWTALSTTGAPTARTGHTATWAGGKMVVFGGRAGAYGLATGAAYDPVTDTWEALPTSGAPSGRWQHTAVAAGGEVIVWGGQSSSWSSPLATGARLDLASWAWVPLPAGPSARSRHAAVWTGEEMIVLGGAGYSAALATGGRWIPRLGVWAALDAPSALVDHAAVWTGTEVVAWGGASGAGPLRYAPASRRWPPSASAASAPALRARPSLCWTGAEVVVWGGASGTSGVGQLGRYRP